MKRIRLVLLLTLLAIPAVFSQVGNTEEVKILFHGLVMDASTLSPLANSQITINRSFSSVTDQAGTFSILVNRKDTVVFSRMGYRPTMFYVSDTLAGRKFIAGIYMKTDTLSIGEVVIVPRLRNLKSEILNARPESQPEIENAKYNLAVSAYQGRQGQNKLGDPASNYELLRQKQRITAYEKGGIPSDKMLGLSPLLLLPAAYLLIHGLPEKPAPFKPQLTGQEVDQIHKKYLETLKQRK